MCAAVHTGGFFTSGTAQNVTWGVHNGAMQRPIPFIAPEVFEDADAALQRVRVIYEQSLNHLREAMRRYVAGEPMVDKIRACYPFCLLYTSDAPTICSV